MGMGVIRWSTFVFLIFQAEENHTLQKTVKQLEDEACRVKHELANTRMVRQV